MIEATPIPRARLSQALWPVVIVAVIIAVLVFDPSLRVLLAEAFARVKFTAVLVTLPVQLMAIIVCVSAQQCLKPGVSFRASFASRLVRDAANHLVILPPGFGDAVGTRMMVLAGGRLRAALSVRALDILAEVLGQLPFMALAFWVLWQLEEGVQLPALIMPGGAWFSTVLAGAALIALALVWKFAPVTMWVRRMRIEVRQFRREIRRRWRGMPVAIVLHAIGWGLSGLQLWLAAQMFGFKLSLFGAIALESAASSSRIILFFVPGGLGAQEAAIIAAGLAFALAPAQSLALALVLRLRDLVFGLGLIWWPLLESRAYKTRK